VYPLKKAHTLEVAGCWFSDEEVLMRLSDHILKTVVFVGYEDADGDFCPGGTGFFLGRSIERADVSMIYLVTAKHVIDKCSQYAGSGSEGSVVIRFNRLDGSSGLMRVNVDMWTTDPHDDYLDLAILPLSPEEHGIDYRFAHEDGVLNSDAVEALDIGIGDEVFFAGLFVHHPGAVRNIPIMRLGTIAAMPDEKVTVDFDDNVQHPIDAYLAEARSIGGLSGSPVFVRTDGVRGTSIAITEPRFALLGVMRGHWAQTVFTTATLRPWEIHKEVVNMGITIVIPASKVLKLTDLPQHLEHRRAEAARLA
jgi:hypothetical protein